MSEMNERKLCMEKTKDGLCGQPAVAIKMYWPNNPAWPVCAEHKAKAEQIANARGFYLEFTALADTEDTEK